ncbi:MAG: hypothetical protein RRB13_02695 [bacterium]|nr:hypothetical protein [bacterium]
MSETLQQQILDQLKDLRNDIKDLRGDFDKKWTDHESQNRDDLKLIFDRINALEKDVALVQAGQRPYFSAMRWVAAAILAPALAALGTWLALKPGG